MLADSGLLQDLEAYVFSPAGLPMCIYGDPAYPLRVHLQGPFGNPHLTPLMEAFNASVSSVRISVAWLFRAWPPPPPPPSLGILFLEVERNRTLYKTISNLPDCSCDYPWPVIILMLETKKRSNFLRITVRVSKNRKGGFKCCLKGH